MASSTTIPNASRKENNTIMFKVKPMVGRNMNAMKDAIGTDKPTNKALVVPRKNISTNVTRMNPRIMEFTRSDKVFLVVEDWSPVMVSLTFSGKSFLIVLFVISRILSEASTRFSPLRLITFKVITGFPSKRA